MKEHSQQLKFTSGSLEHPVLTNSSHYHHHHHHHPLKTLSKAVTNINRTAGDSALQNKTFHIRKSCVAFRMVT